MFGRKKPEVALPEEHTQGLSALYSGLLENCAELKAGIAAIETKALTVLTASIAIITLYSTVASLKSMWTPYGSGILCLSGLIAATTVVRKEYKTPVRKLGRKDKFLWMKDEPLLLQLISDAQDATRISLKALEDKGVLFKWSVITLIIGVTVCEIPSFITILK